MTDLFIDIETYSRVDLTSSGVYRYVEDDDFQILMAAWSLNGGPIRVTFGHENIIRIPGLYDPTVRKIAHNAQFERICFSELASVHYLNPEQWHDTMAVAAELGYPQKLEVLAKWLGGEQKDTAGTRLINLFCRPNRRGEQVSPGEKPEEWDLFVAYCRQDVATLIDVHRRLGEFPTETERRVYLADQRINDMGLAVDVEMARRAVEAAEENQIDQELEVMGLTGVTNPSSRDQLLRWLQNNGLKIPDLRAETVSAYLSGGELNESQRRVLELRQELALAAPKKYAAVLDAVCEDGRLRGGFRFFGAHTGRWAGRGVQPHNLPREQLETEDETDAAILDLKMGLGATTHTLKALVRALFVGPFSVVDYSAIEARVVAWLAGEQWALDAFESGRDIYVETAERMSTATQKFSRRDGKIAVLALGYNGGINSLRAMGAEGDDFSLRRIVNTWRMANEMIVSFWGEMERAFYSGGEVGRIVVEKDGDTRRLRLPSGRAIHYHDCRWRWVDTQFGPKREASFADPRKPGARVKTYGGRLTENVTQAVARDVLAEALVRLVDAGFRPVGHIHDEILVEGDAVDEVREIMIIQPEWADGLPIDAEGQVFRRYRKG